jgi:hypothetical protein
MRMTLDEAASKAVMASMQTGVGELMHPDAQAIVCLAFRTAGDAEMFRLAYIRLKNPTGGGG